jgi:RNA polymerase sigma factor (sigma-70 family)
MSAWDYSHDVDLHESEMRRLVTRALLRLSPRAERVMRLRYFEGQTYAAIAAEFGVSAGRIQQIAEKAERTLRRSVWPTAKHLLTECVQ